MPKHSKLKILKQEQSQLWTDHYWFTRQVIVDAVWTITCFDGDLASLYQNQVNLGKIFAKLTHKKAGDKLTRALTEHIDIAVKIVTALIEGQPIDELYKLWQANATQIAKIYAHYNHCIKFKLMNKLMQEHLETTAAEARAIVAKNCTDSTKTGDIALAHVRMMADYINSKFPCAKDQRQGGQPPPNGGCQGCKRQ